MNMEQQRAQHAWKVIQGLMEEGKAKPHGKEFRSEAKKFPSRVMTAGLGQAVAFLLSKSNDDNKKSKGVRELVAALNGWVCGKTAGLAAENSGNLMLSIANGDTLFLTRATEEALAYIQWINRFAEAEGIKGEEEGEA